MDSDLIAKIISEVFPPRSHLAWNANEVAPEDRFWIIPGKEGPRWIVPQNPRHGWQVLRCWRPYDLSSRLKWMGLMAAYRTGQLGAVPRIVAIGVAGASEKDCWRHLGWKSSIWPVPVIYVGTPGPTRKAVVHLMDAISGKASGVAKIPLESLAAKNILREADILKSLEEEKPGIAPRLQYVDRALGISLQDSINGRASSRRLTQAHIDWLRSLQAPGKETSLRKESEALMKRLVQLEALEETTRRLLQDVLEQLDDPTPLPAAWVHGDFAPWNLKWVEKGMLAAVDWEEARPSGLSGIDLIYFHVIQDFLFCDNAPDKAWQQLQGFVSSSLVRSYIERFWHLEKLLTSLALFTLADMLIRRALIVNVASDRFCKYLQNLIKRMPPCVNI